MPDIDSIIIAVGSVRCGRGTNSEQTAVLDRARDAHKALRFEETDRGVLVFNGSDLITLVTWGKISQVMYAPMSVTPDMPTKAETPDAKRGKP